MRGRRGSTASRRPADHATGSTTTVSKRASRLGQCADATLQASGNAATDDVRTARFKWLHGMSVLVSLAHIVVSGVVLARFV